MPRSFYFVSLILQFTATICIHNTIDDPNKSNPTAADVFVNGSEAVNIIRKVNEYFKLECHYKANANENSALLRKKVGNGKTQLLSNHKYSKGLVFVVFKKLKKTDNATYECVLNVDNRSFLKLFNLIVQWEVELYDDPDSCNNLRNEHREFQCNVTGNPAPSITWYARNSSGDTPVFSAFVSFDSYKTIRKDWHGNILIVPVNSESKYYCEAVNTINNIVYKKRSKPCEVIISGGNIPEKTSVNPSNLNPELTTPVPQQKCYKYRGGVCSQYITQTRVNDWSTNADLENFLREFRENVPQQIYKNVSRIALCHSIFHPCVSVGRPLCKSICERAMSIAKANTSPIFSKACASLNDDAGCFKLDLFVDVVHSTCYRENVAYYYNGSVSESNNAQCLNWDSVKKGKINTSITHYDLRGHKNYCRHLYEFNPDPVCFVNGANTPRTCDIPKCVPSLLDRIISVVSNLDQPFMFYVFFSVGIMLLLGIFVFAAVCYCRCNRNIELAHDNEAIPMEKLRENPLYQTPTVAVSPQIANRFPHARNGYAHPSPHASITNIHFGHGQPTSTRYISPYQRPVRRNVLSDIPPKSNFSKLEYDRNKIQYVRDIAQGGFGRVFQAKAPGLISAAEHRMNDGVVAVKMLKEDATSEDYEDFEREAKLVSNFNHPNVIKLLAVCSVGKPFCLIFSYMIYGDLNQFLRECGHGRDNKNSVFQSYDRTLEIADQILIAQQISSGMAYISEKHYLHRDLATRNCLVTHNLVVRISDFGMSKSIADREYLEIDSEDHIPIRWMAPEALFQNRYNKMSDVWAFGVLLWEIFSFALQPYYGMNHDDVIQYVGKGHILDCPENVPDDIYDLMKLCWSREMSKRPAFRPLYEKLDQLLKTYTAVKPEPPTSSSYC